MLSFIKGDLTISLSESENWPSNRSITCPKALVVKIVHYSRRMRLKQGEGSLLKALTCNPLLYGANAAAWRSRELIDPQVLNLRPFS